MFLGINQSCLDREKFGFFILLQNWCVLDGLWWVAHSLNVIQLKFQNLGRCQFGIECG